MVQSLIIDVLIKSSIPLNRGQIAEQLGEDAIKISHSLKKLLRWKDIECIEVDRNKAAELLNSDSPLRRMRFYYIGKTKRRYLI